MQMNNGKAWLAPLTGVLFFVVIVAAVLVLGEEPPDPTKDSAQEVVDFYKDNDDQAMLSAVLFSFAGALLVFFGGWLRGILRAAPGSTDVLSTIAFGGALVLAAGLATNAAFQFAAADLVDDVDSGVINTLNALTWDFFFPMAVGTMVMTIAAGLSIVRHGGLPKWLGWVAIVIGLVAHTPLGFFGALAGALWIVVVSVLGVIGARRASTA
jgi:hypothetical protein